MIHAITTSFVSKNNAFDIQAVCEGGTLASSFNSDWNVEKNHHRAAADLLTQMGWKGSLHAGPVLPSGEQIWAVIPEWMSDFGRWCADNDVYVADALPAAA